MENVIKLDWAQKVIEELKDIEPKDEAVSNFITAFAHGDTAEAWEAYDSASREVLSPDNGQNYLFIFPDGSGYADWNQGIDCFCPDASDALTEEEWEALDR